MSQCPCVSKKDLAKCCTPMIAGAPVHTAEAIMRSRYAAFATKQLDHLERTHATEVKADLNRAEAEYLAESGEWSDL